MSVKAHITDGLGSQREALVTPSNALLVQVLPETSGGVDPADLARQRLLNEFFLNDLGSAEQTVNASVTPVEYRIISQTGLNKWITGFRVIIEANNFEIATADFRRYGAIVAPGLTNGIVIEAVQGGVTTPITVEPIRVAGDYLNYADGFTNFVNAITAQADYLQFTFEFARPIVLLEGSLDRLIIRIRDDLTAALLSSGTPRQYAVARGYRESV